MFAAGSALAGILVPRLGLVRTAMLARVANGLGAVAMGLAAGPAALVAFYVLTYAFHGTAGAISVLGVLCYLPTLRGGQESRRD